MARNTGSRLSNIGALDLTGDDVRKYENYSDAEWLEIKSDMNIYVRPKPGTITMPKAYAEIQEDAIDLMRRPPASLPKAGQILFYLMTEYDDRSQWKYALSCMPQNEDYFKKVWSTIIGLSLDSTGYWVCHGETVSSTASDALNDGRAVELQPRDYQHSGKYDGIILSEELQHGVTRREYGFIEVSVPTKDNKWNAKFIKDHIKIIHGAVLSLRSDPNPRAVRISFLGIGFRGVLAILGKLQGGVIGLYEIDTATLPDVYDKAAFETFFQMMCHLRETALIMKMAGAGTLCVPVGGIVPVEGTVETGGEEDSTGALVEENEAGLEVS